MVGDVYISGDGGSYAAIKPKSPAGKKGIQLGDTLAMVQGTDVSFMSLTEVKNQIKKCTQRPLWIDLIRNDPPLVVARDENARKNMPASVKKANKAREEAAALADKIKDMKDGSKQQKEAAAKLAKLEAEKEATAAAVRAEADALAAKIAAMKAGSKQHQEAEKKLALLEDKPPTPRGKEVEEPTAFAVELPSNQTHLRIKIHKRGNLGLDIGARGGADDTTTEVFVCGRNGSTSAISEKSPAGKKDLVLGDQIVAVNGVDTTGMSLNQVKGQIKKTTQRPLWIDLIRYNPPLVKAQKDAKGGALPAEEPVASPLIPEPGQLIFRKKFDKKGSLNLDIAVQGDADAVLPVFICGGKGSKSAVQAKSAAGKAGLELGDTILAVQGQDTTNMTLNEVKTQIKNTTERPIWIDFLREDPTAGLEALAEEPKSPKSPREGGSLFGPKPEREKVAKLVALMDADGSGELSPEEVKVMLSKFLDMDEEDIPDDHEEVLALAGLKTDELIDQLLNNVPPDKVNGFYAAMFPDEAQI